jgi:hypothetical protein
VPAVPLTLIQTDPTGPSAGSGLDVGPDQVCVLRRGVLGSRRGPCVPRAAVRGFAHGGADRVREQSWITAAALVALDRAEAADPGAPFLAVAWEGPATTEVWLFSGTLGAVEQAAHLLAITPVHDAGHAGEAVLAPPPARRRSGALAGILAVLILGGVVAAAVVLVRDRVQSVGDLIPDSPPPPPPERPEPETPPPPPGGDDGDELIAAEPYGVRAVVRALTAAEVVRGGWAIAGAPRLDGFRALVPLRYRGAPARIEVYPSYQAALGRARGLAVQTGNVVVRYPAPAGGEAVGVLVRAVQASR